MKLRRGNVYQSSSGSCYKILGTPEPFEGLGEFVDVIYYAGSFKHRMSVNVTSLERCTLIYIAPTKRTLSKADEKFYKDVHDQIKCL
jgi:hypothetical protein